VIAFAVLIAIVGLALAGWFTAKGKAAALHTGRGSLHSLPRYHGLYVALWTLVPALALWAVWSIASPVLVERMIVASPAGASLPMMDLERQTVLSEARQIAADPSFIPINPLSPKFAAQFAEVSQHYALIGAVLCLIVALAGGGLAFTRIAAAFPARTRFERLAIGGLLAASLIAILTTLGILASLVFESARFFSFVSPLDFLTGTHWSPPREIEPGMGAKFGAAPLFWGTLYIGAFVAMLVAIPLGLMSAIFLTQYASPTMRRWCKPILEILAGIPTVVYGYFAALTIAPRVRDFATLIGIENASTESALAAGLVMGVMIIPFVSSMADDSIAAVPQAMRDGSLAMGATRSETIKRVLIPAALPGIVSGVMLAVSRAIGETMIVVMAAGATARISANPFTGMTTVTRQIVELLTGDQEFDTPKTLSAFALGLVLFGVTFALNVIALRVVKRFREAYE